MKNIQYLWVSLLLLNIVSIQGYRILCLFPYNGKSHYQLTGALCKALAEHGHQIDMISHFPAKTPIANYTDIVNLQGTKEALVNNFTVNNVKDMNSAITFYIATTFGNDICALMGHEKMQKFIKNLPKNPPYDLIITEYFGSNCYFGFGRFLNIPLIGIATNLEFSFMDEVIGNPLSSSFHLNALADFPVLSNFWQRLTNTVVNFMQPRIFNYYSLSQTDDMRKYLRKDMPDIREIEKDMALLFVNSHYSFHGIRPVTPGLIEIGGLHVEMDRSQLTPELKKWMDSADDGVVYFTLGSLVNIETIPNNTLLELYESFRKIAPIRVLMKIANKDKLPPNLPSNVITLSWIPQMAVLRHHNTRVFITHGGLMGSLEAVYNGIPVIGIPLFGDQHQNINVFVQKGIGVKLSYKDLSGLLMDTSLNYVLNNSIYTPLTARQKAIFWTDYIVRNGPKSLRSPTMDMSWWQTNLIDVYGCLIVLVIVIVYFLAIVVKVLISILKNINTLGTSKLKKY